MPPLFDAHLDGIVYFLCNEREFGRERVLAALDRTYGKKQSSLEGL